MQNIIENATIIQKNGGKKIYDAIQIMANGVYTGVFRSEKNHQSIFVHHSFIPKDQIQKIVFFDGSGKLIDIDFKKMKRR